MVRISIRTPDHRPQKLACICLFLAITAAGRFGSAGVEVAAAEPIQPPREFLQLSEQFCADCHLGDDAESQIDFSVLADESMASGLADWRRIIAVLKEGTMPPEDAAQPESQQRVRAADQLAALLQQAIRSAADDPGPAIMRRITNAEFDYCIEDLTGLELNLGDQLVSDSVGGSGFTGMANAQFMQETHLERYLEAAKIVADHTMIGAGPLYFHSDPGQTGLELSAIQRIKRLYRRHGYRASAGEGAKPYGLDRFATAFLVAWQYRYRDQLGSPAATLEQLAAEAKLEPKFARHIWTVLQTPQPKFPLSDIIERWRQFTPPKQIRGKPEVAIRAEADSLFAHMQSWQRRFAGSASAEEEAALLTSNNIDVPASVDFVARALRKRIDPDDNFTPDINNPNLYSADGRVRFLLTIEPASPDIEPRSVVIFSNPEFQFRFTDIVQPDPVTLRSVLPPAVTEELAFGQNEGGESIGEDEFVVRVGESKTIEVELPPTSRIGQLTLTARLDRELSRHTVVRCTIEDATSERGKQYSSLLRDLQSETMDRWEEGLEQFAAALPQISHREPAPSDRDPIPEPYDNTYNLPERNFFHTAVKYHREDAFLRNHLMPDEVLEELDVAWVDLLTSFDYHQVNLRFTAGKVGVDLGDRTIETIDRQWIESLPTDVRRLVVDYKSEYEAMHSRLRESEQGHLDDILAFATRAWRRELSQVDAELLRQFYRASREQNGLSHAEAVRALIARVLVSPDFLYRIERPSDDVEPTELTPYELASRLSFSIWSSLPDAELLTLAQNGRLTSPEVLSAQVDRMLGSPKSRRLATEFFGQWLGFYQFDRFRGIDQQRFPEFDDALRRSLYDEAISFFEHIIRNDRPYDEILQADYTFLDRRSAQHYGIDWADNTFADDHKQPISKKRDVSELSRGGLLGMGAILASTSAPLRTSPVKRGDWITRRLLGTPVPPPPPDAGSIAAEEVAGDGSTVRERLEAHRDRPECRNCHVRIDPLGFALENFDPLGRWREHYLDRQPIDASAALGDGETIRGFAGLKQHLGSQDRLFRRSMATRLVAYFMGRAESASDAALIDDIISRWENDSRFSVAVRTIVESPQFRLTRGRQSSLEHAVSASSGARK